MFRKCNDPLKTCRSEVLRAFKETVLSSTKSRYLSLSEKSAMIGCLLEFVDTCYNYIDKK